MDQKTPSTHGPGNPPPTKHGPENQEITLHCPLWFLPVRGLFLQSPHSHQSLALNTNSKVLENVCCCRRNPAWDGNLHPQVAPVHISIPIPARHKAVSTALASLWQRLTYGCMHPHIQAYLPSLQASSDVAYPVRSMADVLGGSMLKLQVNDGPASTSTLGREPSGDGVSPAPTAPITSTLR